MPKIRIKERDLTTNPLVGSTTNDILYVQVGILQSVEPPRFLTDDDIEKIARLAHRAATSEDGKLLVNGQLFTASPADANFLRKVLSLGGRVIIANNWRDALNYCSDRNQYDIKFILAREGITVTKEGITVDNPKVEGATSELDLALQIAQKRKDCVVVYSKISPSYDPLELRFLTAKCAYISTRKKDPSEFYSDEVRTSAGKYVLSFYAPGDVHDDSMSVSAPNILDAGKAYILAFLDNVAKGRAEWLAIAGSVRGAIPGSYKVDGYLKEEDIDNMQPRVFDDMYPIAINPIVNMNPWGTRIWGNRTCLPNTNVTIDGGVAADDFGNVALPPTDQLVASSFANIRIAICDIKKAIYKAARRYQFEQNTDVLWVNFTSSVNSLLEEMKSSYGIVGYRWKRDTANEQRGELRAILQITPIEAVEDFTITCELKDSLDNNVKIAEEGEGKLPEEEIGGGSRPRERE